jgi:hypothetical protein
MWSNLNHQCKLESRNEFPRSKSSTCKQMNKQTNEQTNKWGSRNKNKSWGCFSPKKSFWMNCYFVFIPILKGNFHYWSQLVVDIAIVVAVDVVDVVGVVGAIEVTAINFPAAVAAVVVAFMFVVTLWVFDYDFLLPSPTSDSYWQLLIRSISVKVPLGWPINNSCNAGLPYKSSHKCFRKKINVAQKVHSMNFDHFRILLTKSSYG